MLVDSAGDFRDDPQGDARDDLCAVVVRYDEGPSMHFLTFRRRWTCAFRDAELMTPRDALKEAKHHAGCVEVVLDYGTLMETSMKP